MVRVQRLLSAPRKPPIRRRSIPIRPRKGGIEPRNVGGKTETTNAPFGTSGKKRLKTRRDVSDAEVVRLVVIDTKPGEERHERRMQWKSWQESTYVACKGGPTRRTFTSWTLHDPRATFRRWVARLVDDRGEHGINPRATFLRVDDGASKPTCIQGRSDLRSPTCVRISDDGISTWISAGSPHAIVYLQHNRRPGPPTWTSKRPRSRASHLPRKRICTRGTSVARICRTNDWPSGWNTQLGSIWQASVDVVDAETSRKVWSSCWNVPKEVQQHRCGCETCLDSTGASIARDRNVTRASWSPAHLDSSTVPLASEGAANLNDAFGTVDLIALVQGFEAARIAHVMEASPPSTYANTRDDALRSVAPFRPRVARPVPHPCDGPFARIRSTTVLQTVHNRTDSNRDPVHPIHPDLSPPREETLQLVGVSLSRPSTTLPLFSWSSW